MNAEWKSRWQSTRNRKLRVCEFIRMVGDALLPTRERLSIVSFYWSRVRPTITTSTSGLFHFISKPWWCLAWAPTDFLRYIFARCSDNWGKTRANIFNRTRLCPAKLKASDIKWGFAGEEYLKWNEALFEWHIALRRLRSASLYCLIEQKWNSMKAHRLPLRCGVNIHVWLDALLLFFHSSNWR